MTRRRPPTLAEVTHALRWSRTSLVLLGINRHTGACARHETHPLTGVGLCSSCEAIEETSRVLARLADNDGRIS
jgi:hypothetical protein